MQASCFNDGLELRRRALNTVNTSHHGHVAVVTVANIVTIVGREWVWGGCQLGTPLRRVHNLVSDEDARVRVHSGSDFGEYGNGVGIGPVVTDEPVVRLLRLKMPPKRIKLT
jgi:hypothetical protein